jgi:double-stranded uracil-DNA glycosylase
VKLTSDQRAAVLRRRVPDVIAPHLGVLFCGINPGLYSAAARHHFAGPSNRFWPTLQAAGFTPTLLRPADEATLLRLGLGITNLAPRATPMAGHLSTEELRRGARQLLRKVRAFQPRILAILGLGAYRLAFAEPRAVCGLQERTIDETRIWLLPNPSGLNAHHSSPELIRLFRALHRYAALPRGARSAPRPS